MLILTRRPGERVVIGDEILVTVMAVSGHTVRLGIAAPPGIQIYREEIWLAVKEENRAAAAAAPDALPAELPAQPTTNEPPKPAHEPAPPAMHEPSEPAHEPAPPAHGSTSAAHEPAAAAQDPPSDSVS